MKVKEINDEDLEDSTADSIFKTVDQNFNEVLPFIEETIDRWNSRT